MLNITLKSLVKFLDENGYESKIQEETQQIYTIIKISGRDFPLFVRIFDTGELLQLLAFMPCQIKGGNENDLARLLHLFNKELDLPGFGMDETSRVAFYRCMIPIPGKKVDPKILISYLSSIYKICEQISPPVIAVASGLSTYSEILEKSNQQTNPPITP